MIKQDQAPEHAWNSFIAQKLDDYISPQNQKKKYIHIWYNNSFSLFLIVYFCDIKHIFP